MRRTAPRQSARRGSSAGSASSTGSSSPVFRWSKSAHEHPESGVQVRPEPQDGYSRVVRPRAPPDRRGAGTQTAGGAHAPGHANPYQEKRHMGRLLMPSAMPADRAEVLSDPAEMVAANDAAALKQAAD